MDARPSNAPLISVIVPIYNGARFLRSCFDSILAQTHSSLEILVVDGASRDGTLEILKEYAAACPRFRFISEPDDGQADAINKGFAMAEGEFLTWLNADDRLAPDAFEQAVRAFSNQPGAVLVYGSVINIREDGTFLALNPGRPWPKEELVFNDFIPQAGAMLRNTKGLKVDKNLNWSFDWELWIRLSQKGDLVCLPHLMGYCIVEGNYSRKSNMISPQRTRELLGVTQRYAKGFSPRLLAVYVCLALGWLLSPLKLVFRNYYGWIVRFVGKTYETTAPDGKGIML